MTLLPGLNFESDSMEAPVQLIFVVVDVGESMRSVGVERLNGAVAGLFREIAADPLLDDKALIGILEYSDTVEVLLTPTSVSNVNSIPSLLQSDTDSSFGRMFRRLHGEIYSAVSAQIRNGKRVLRPLVLLVSQGVTSDDSWRVQHAELCAEENRARPWIVSVGYLGANWDNLSAMATVFESPKQKVVWDIDSVSLGAMISRLFSLLVHS